MPTGREGSLALYETCSSGVHMAFLFYHGSVITIVYQPLKKHTKKLAVELYHTKYSKIFLYACMYTTC